MRFNHFKFILGLGFLAACAVEQSPPPSVPQTNIEIAPKGQDHRLNHQRILEHQAELKLWNQAGDAAQLTDGYQLFNMFTELMEIGDIENRPEIRKVGHDLVQTFYGNKANTLQVSPEQSLYLETALGEKKKVLIELLDQKLEGLSRSYGVITSVLSETSQWEADIRQAALSQFGLKLNSFLLSIIENLKAQNASVDVIKGLQEELGAKYLPIVEKLNHDLSLVSLSRSLKENLESLHVIEQMPLEPETTAKIKKQLKEADDLESKISKMNSGKQALAVVLDIWLMLDESGRAQYIKPVSAELYDHLKSKDAKYINDLKNGSWSNFSTYYPHWKLTGAIESYGVERLKGELLSAINQLLITTFESQMRLVLVGLPKMIESKFIASVKEKEKEYRVIRQDYNYRDFFAKLSVAWGKREIFDGHLTINGFERDRYLFGHKSDRNFLIIPDSRSRAALTSSMSMGAAFGLAAERFRRAEEFEGISYDSSGYFRLILEVLNKIPAVGGFNRIDDKTFPSFHAAINESAPYSKAMDIKTQFGGPDYFVVPDYIQLKGVSEIAISETLNYQLPVSVRGQAELLAGLSSLMNFFKDWKSNNFDVQMGRYVLGNLIPDLPANLEREPLFPKEKIYEYLLGVSSIILENLKRPNSGVFFLTRDHKWIPSEQMDQARREQALMAGYVNRTRFKLGDEMKSADMSRFIVGMTRFLQATEGIEQSKSSTVKHLLQPILEARSQVKLLSFMMGNFLVRQMQRENGLVDSAYSYSQNKVVSQSLHFEDQLEAILAFVELSKTLQMFEFRARAYEIYFGLNHFFWSEEAMYYSNVLNSNLKGEFKKPPPRNFVLSLRALSALKSSPGPDYSQGQIAFLVETFLQQIK